VTRGCRVAARVARLGALKRAADAGERRRVDHRGCPPVSSLVVLKLRTRSSSARSRMSSLPASRRSIRCCSRARPRCSRRRPLRRYCPSLARSTAPRPRSGPPVVPERCLTSRMIKNPRRAPNPASAKEAPFPAIVTTSGSATMLDRDDPRERAVVRGLLRPALGIRAHCIYDRSATKVRATLRVPVWWRSRLI